MENKNFYDIYNKYMSMTKEELAQLLTAKEMLEVDYNIYVEKQPFVTPFDFETIGSHCKTWDDCTNPCRDCINCPLRFTSGGWKTNVSTSTGATDFNTSVSTKDYKDCSFYTTDYKENDSIINRLRKMADY